MTEQASEVTLLEVYRVIGRIETKVDTYAAGQNDHEARINKIEKRNTWIAGAAAACASMITFALGVAGILPR